VPPQEIFGAVELGLAQGAADASEAVLVEVRPDASAV
jgi:hypothetical protein